MEEQGKLDIQAEKKLDTVEEYKFEPIKGYPMLHWKGKRPFNSTQYYPAQLKENYGIEDNNWMNKIFWGDNLQVMSHLLKEYRGKIDLVYIDPPFDSKADYKKKISLKGKQVSNDQNSFEEKQYTDIWNNDDYLQFMYERLVLIKELLSDKGSIFLHCDWHKNHYLKCILEEIFGSDNIVNEIVWRRKGGSALGSMKHLSTACDTIYWFSKSSDYTINSVFSDAPEAYINKQFRNQDDDGRRYMITVMRSPSLRPNLMYDYKGYKMPPNGWAVPLDSMIELDKKGYLHFPDSKTKQIYKKIYLDEYKGHAINNLWADISTLKGSNKEIVNYPTQKPEELIERILTLASNPNDIIFDCFMGSGTTQAVAAKTGRRFIGADINLGAIETTIKRLDKQRQQKNSPLGFSVYNVNNYDVFRNPIEAKEILKQALEIQPLPNNTIYDGEKDGKMVKIMPVNRIATRADLNELISGFNYKSFEKKSEKEPNKAVESLLLICMGHEPDLAASLQKEVPYKLDIAVVDILRDKANLEFKRDSEAEVVIEEDKLIVKQFYPMNLLQKLSLMKENVENWKELTETVKIDFNYDGSVFEPTVVDVPEKNEMVVGKYEIPEDAGTIRIKITDLLSESLELTIDNN